MLQFPQGLRGGGHEQGHLNRDQREEGSQQGGRLGIEPSLTGQELRGSVCGELGVSESSEEASASGVACVVVGVASHVGPRRPLQGSSHCMALSTGWMASDFGQVSPF